MGYHNRIETPYLACFITARIRRSELWFANNLKVERFILALLAKLQERYKVIIYAFAIEGSHYHLLAKFPHMNRADFCRDFNSGIAHAVERLTPSYPGGKLWGRRYSCEYIYDDADIEQQFFYTVLQAIQDGLVQKISEYPGYNCFHDAIHGYDRKFNVVNWKAFNDAKRHNPLVSIKDFTEEKTLKYTPVPGYEKLTEKEYAKKMQEKIELRRQKIIKERKVEKGKTKFLGRAALLKIKTGTPAMDPKTSDPHSFRPRVLGEGKNYKEGIAWYFEIHFAYKEASKRYRAGDFDVAFPPGTYRPPVWMVVRPSGPFTAI